MTVMPETVRLVNVAAFKYGVQVNLASAQTTCEQRCRVYADGPHLPPRLQSTAVCKGSAVHIINTSLEPNQSNVSRLGSFVRKILEHSHTSTKKAPNTAGFLAAVVAQAAGILDSQPLAHGNADTEIMYERAISNSTAAGVFRDVGRRAGSQRLPTCWPLVQEAFRFVASQVGLPLICSAAILPSGTYIDTRGDGCSATYHANSWATELVTNAYGGDVLVRSSSSL